MTATLRMENLTRWYGHVLGVNAITAEIGPGVTGLLGLNGAGKSTLLNLLAGHLRPDFGSAYVCGRRVGDDWSVYYRLGYCPDAEKGFGNMSGMQFLTHHLRVSGYGRRQARARAEELLARVGLSEAAQRAAAGYSKGMKQRLKLALADALSPEVVLLDEPLTGLDPQGRAAMSRQIRQWGEEGRTVLVSSHILHEVESLTRRVLLLHRGRLLAEGDVRDIRDEMEDVPRRVVLESPDRLAIRRTLAADPAVLSLEDGEVDGQLTLRTRRLSQFLSNFNESVAREGWRVVRLSTPDESMEAVFRDLLERKGGTRGTG
ncbi:ABC transporter ATP-binding protein [bacterium]|nr:ABC transporter ATP-binding protein [bacterium]